MAAGVPSLTETSVAWSVSSLLAAATNYVAAMLRQGLHELLSAYNVACTRIETVGVDAKFDRAGKIGRPSRIGESQRWTGVVVANRAAGEDGVARRYCADDRTT